jgi:hypothetical protein
MSNAELIADLELRAAKGPNGMLISKSMFEHFGEIVQAMNQVGAVRHGSQVVSVGGRQYIVDRYTLPNGKTILAGYGQ